MSAYRILGLVDDETTCACCGRTDLKRAIALAELDVDGHEINNAVYGSTCAARLIAPKSTASASRHLNKLATAISFIEKHAGRGFTLAQIANAVGVKFSVWAVVEDDALKVNTGTGWLTVVTR